MSKKNEYNYPLRLDLKHKKPLKKMAKERRNSMNDEINFAIEYWLLKHQEESKPSNWAKS